MSSAGATFWPWLALAGLGVFHGLNPAMGWLFAVALGLHRGNRRIVLEALLPIALGHALSVAIVLTAFLALGIFVDYVVFARIGGAVLLGWAAWHLLYGHRQKLRVGMRTGLAGLFLWSFLMASAHGAGLMLIPALLPLCAPAASTLQVSSASALWTSLAALALHTAAMLATIAAISLAVYEWFGLGFLRQSWINLDWIWAGALVACGLILLAA
jgi:hypothetical protein